MIPTSFMLVAGEASGDRLAAELVAGLRKEWRDRQAQNSSPSLPMPAASGPVFFGAGADAMRDAGVEIIEDMSQRGVIGISDVARRLIEFAALLNRLIRLAAERQPDVIICVDYGGFNLQFQSRLRRLIRSRSSPFNNWCPKLVQFVSPQVWGSRPGRANQMERNLDLLISILPFEKEWFAKRTPKLRVEFVGHPLIGRHGAAIENRTAIASAKADPPLIVLLPGSRRGELRHHLPVVVEAARRIRQQMNCRFKLVVPSQRLAELARAAIGNEPVDIVVGELSSVLRGATLAISKTGTITLELALFGVPAITFYKTTPLTYHVARRVVQVRWLSMPNLLANEAVYPEFVQDNATGQTLADAALELLRNDEQRKNVTKKLASQVSQLGSPGAPDRAAHAIFELYRPAKNS